MANAFEPGAEPESAGPPPDDAGGGGGGGGGGGAPPGGPPGGGPLLAMLGRQQNSPPVTAPGPGNIAQGMMLLSQAHGLMTQALQNFPPGSPQWKDCHQAIGRIGRHMAQGPPAAGVQQTQLGDMLKNVVKNALLQRIMQSKSQAVGGGAPGGDPGSSQPGIPSPSTPLPGA